MATPQQKFPFVMMLSQKFLKGKPSGSKKIRKGAKQWQKVKKKKIIA